MSTPSAPSPSSAATTATEPARPAFRKTEAIDQHPLRGAERRRYEDDLIARTGVAGVDQLTLRILLDKRFRGRADCFPGNDLIAKDCGRTSKCKARNARRNIRNLVKRSAILSIVDLSIPAKRRLIAVGHPNAAMVLRELAKSPHIMRWNSHLKDALERATMGDKNGAPMEDKNGAPMEDKNVHRSASLLETHQPASLLLSSPSPPARAPNPSDAVTGSSLLGHGGEEAKLMPPLSTIPRATLARIRGALGDELTARLAANPGLVTPTIGQRWDVLEYGAQQLASQRNAGNKIDRPLDYLVAVMRYAIAHHRVPA
jgi:hypothetical protein